jgi:pectate lyase
MGTAGVVATALAFPAVDARLEPDEPTRQRRTQRDHPERDVPRRERRLHQRQMFSHHVWIDHNDLAQGFDGLIDIKRGSSYITVSWDHTRHHTKNMLLGHDDGNSPPDVGRLKVTYHHNWLDNTPSATRGCASASRCTSTTTITCITPTWASPARPTPDASWRPTTSRNTEETVTNQYAGPTGRCVVRNNVLVGDSGPPD